MNPTKTHLLVILLVFGASTACSPSAKIKANKDPSYLNDPKRIFVLTSIEKDLGKEFSIAFQKSIISNANYCSAEMEVSFLKHVELDESLYDVKKNAFNSDSFLSIKSTRIVLGPGKIGSVTYDVRFVDVPANTLVWHANIEFYPNYNMISSIDEQAQTLVSTLIDKLRKDQILRHCGAK